MTIVKGLSASVGGVQVGGQQVAKTAASARSAAETQTRHAAAVTGSRRATPGDLGAAHGGRTECGRAIGRADGLPGGGKGLTPFPCRGPRLTWLLAMADASDALVRVCVMYA